MLFVQLDTNLQNSSSKQSLFSSENFQNYFFFLNNFFYSSMNDLFCNQMKAESEFEEHTQHVYQLRTRKDDSGKGFDSLIRDRKFLVSAEISVSVCISVSISFSLSVSAKILVQNLPKNPKYLS
jgi:hypothetical protein